MVNVKFTWSGAATLTTLSVFVYADLGPSAGHCGQIIWPSLPPGYDTRQDLVAVAGASVADGSALLHGAMFFPGATLTVAVLGYGTDPSRPIAVGCSVSTIPVTAATTETTVALSAWN